MRTRCRSGEIYAIIACMGDLIPFLVLAIFCLMAAALFDCVTTDDRTIRLFPKAFWLASIVLLPGLGGVLWFTHGRMPTLTVPEHIASGHPAGRGRVEAAAQTVEVAAPRLLAPDDDPEFLARLAELNRTNRPSDSGIGLGGRSGSESHRDEERLRQWEADLRQREERLRQRGEPPIED
jgi:hypothetical protein